MASEKACSLEALMMEAEVDELIDFTFAELNRRWIFTRSTTPRPTTPTPVKFARGRLH